jgi:hypothetical protein
MMVPLKPEGWPLRMVVKVLLSIASTKPSPRMLSEVRRVVGPGDALLDVGVDRPVVDQRPARPVGEGEAVETAHPQLVDLARRPAHRVLMALGAGLGVVDRPQAVGDRFALLEDAAVEVHLRLRLEAVGQVVEARRRLRGGDSVDHRGSHQHQRDHRLDREPPCPSPLQSLHSPASFTRKRDHAPRDRRSPLRATTAKPQIPDRLRKTSPASQIPTSNF